MAPSSELVHVACLPYCAESHHRQYIYVDQRVSWLHTSVPDGTVILRTRQL